MEQSRIAEGQGRRARAQGAKHEQLQEALASLDPRLREWADGWIFGEVWADVDGDPDVMPFADRMLVAIVALAATNKPDQLRNYLHGALQEGMEPRRIHEALMMLVVYVGFPTALQAMVVWSEVVAAARRRGVEIELPIA